MGAIGALTSVADAAFGEPSFWAVGGFGAMVISGARTVLRTLGYIPADFDHPHGRSTMRWGRRLLQRRRDRLLPFLKRLGKG